MPLFKAAVIRKMKSQCELALLQSLRLMLTGYVPPVVPIAATQGGRVVVVVVIPDAACAGAAPATAIVGTAHAAPLARVLRPTAPVWPVFEPLI